MTFDQVIKVESRRGRSTRTLTGIRGGTTGPDRKVVGQGDFPGDFCWRTSSGAHRRYAGLRADPYGAWRGATTAKNTHEPA